MKKLLEDLSEESENEDNSSEEHNNVIEVHDIELHMNRSHFRANDSNINETEKLDFNQKENNNNVEKLIEEMVSKSEPLIKVEAKESTTNDSLVEFEAQTKTTTAGTLSVLSSGYGSQALTSTQASSKDSISLHLANNSYDETTASNNNISVIEKLPNNKKVQQIVETNGCCTKNDCELNILEDNNSEKVINSENVDIKISSYDKSDKSDVSLKVPNNSMLKIETSSDVDNYSVSSYDSRTDTNSTSDLQSMASVPEWLVVGESVRINPDSKVGVVAYVGKTYFASGIWVGVVLDAPTGKNDGSVNGTVYFSCKPKHGIFVKPEKLKIDPRGRALRAVKASHNHLQNNYIS
jgi:kinesin family protein 13